LVEIWLSVSVGTDLNWGAIAWNFSLWTLEKEQGVWVEAKALKSARNPISTYLFMIDPGGTLREARLWVMLEIR